MTQRTGAWTRRGFGLAFAVLTFFLWCPVGYGSYGKVSRIFGMPSWAVFAIGLAVVLFVLEWLYLFGAGTALTDEQMDHMVSELKKLRSDAPAPEKKGGE